MNPQRDDNQLRRYREASRELDERPAAGTRAAILAAAAREVGAGPVDAQSVRTVRSGRLRWPWAAAAAVMLSTLAVMMATRTEQEQPVFTAPPAPPAEIVRERTTEPHPGTEATPPAVAQAAPPAATAASEPARDAQRSNVAPPPTQPLRKEKRELAAGPEPAAVARPKTEPASETDAVVADARVSEPAARAPAPPPAPAAPPASAAAATATAESASGAIGGLRSSEREAKEQREPREERSQRQDTVAGTAKTAQKPAADENEATIEQRPEDWLQKIVRLRAAGKHDEADAELKRFRERYPQWPVPPAALAPTATR
jgi:hypothetical protein